MEKKSAIEDLQIELAILKAENALLKFNLMQFKLAVDNSPATIVITDANGKIEYANPAFERITGYCLDEAIGKTPRIFKSGKHTLSFYSDLWSRLKNGESWQGEFFNKKKDGSYYWEEAFIGPICNAEGIITHFVAVKLDITYKKQVEDSLKELNTRLKESNTAKDKLFSIIAHDLRNPFGAILSFSGLMSENISLYSIEDIQDMCTMMNQSAQQVYGLLENLLQWARSQTGRIEMHPKEVNLETSVQQVIATLQVQAGSKGVSLFNMINRNCVVWADEHLLSTILRNLISNSVKFTPEGGWVKVSGVCTGSRTEVTVEDAGVGIPPEGIKRLFSIENKYSTKGTIDEAGSGLGLVLCKEFVEKHGGAIKVESMVGVGSKFIFTLPDKSKNDYKQDIYDI